MTRYKVFTRSWWRKNPSWPKGLEPCPGRKRTLTSCDSEDEARAFCRDWNASHEPGLLSIKAEYTAD